MTPADAPAVTDAKLARVRLLLNVGHTMDHLLMLIFPTVVLALMHEWDRPYSELLPLALPGTIAFGACSIPAGWLADRWSRTGMMVAFFFGIGAAAIVTGFAQGPVSIAVGLFLVGVFAAIYHPVGIAMLVSTVSSRIGHTLGVNGVYGNAGLAFAALIAGALAEWWTWRAAFILPGLASIACGVWFWNETRGVPLKAGAGARKTETPRLPRELLVRIFLVVAVSTAAGGVIFNASTNAMPKVFDERLSALTGTTFGIGAIICVVYLVAAMAQLLVGQLIDRHPMKRVFVTVVALQIPLLAVAATLSDVAMIAVAIAIMFFVFGQIPINDAMIARYTADEWRARAYAVRYIVSFSASATAVPLIAWIHASYGALENLFYVLASLAVVVFLAAVAFPADTAVRSTARASA